MRWSAPSRSLLFAASLAACASPAPPAAVAVPTPTSPPAALPPLPPDAPGPGEWVTWSRDRKLAYMKGGFMDAERALFASWEPVRYRDLTCRTCHGAGVDDGKFRMPAMELPRLTRGAGGFQELAAKEPQVLRFMQRDLVPGTARLLGLPSFDMASHTGFGCWQCHVPLESQ